MTELVILVPALRRPQNVEPLAQSIRAATMTSFRIVFICDPDDFAEQRAAYAADCDVMLIAGNYAQKINAGVRASAEPLIFLGADDLYFHPGWLQAATAKMVDPIGVVGTNDLGNPRVITGEHSTHSLVARWYVAFGTIDDPGRLLHEGYPHEFVDDEFIFTARRRGAFAAATDSIVEHLHPHWGKAPTDELYEQHRERMRAGARIFRRRRFLWR
jgi:glycosyltransferase involved in cell wall biosynthesis